MRKVRKEVEVEILDFNELSSVERRLFKCACEVRLHAQAPYSHYWVGCAVLTESSSMPIVRGCNVENVHYEVTHAEGNAIDTMISIWGPSRILALAVVGAPENQKVVWPPPRKSSRKLEIQNVNEFCPSCGHCLQKIAENCFNANGKFDPSVCLLGYLETTGVIYRTTIGDAYPMPFLPQHLGVNYVKDPRVKNPK